MEIDLTPRARLPLCLLDIDGVIALLGPGGGERTFETVAAGYPVRISEAARHRVRRVATCFQIVWCSSWLRDGARAIAPLIGLPDDLPYLPFDPAPDRRPDTPKLAAVEPFVRDRPAAWVDDELGEDALGWAERRELPTLLIECDPRFGLLDDHVDELLDFAARCSGFGPPDEIG